MTLSDYQFEYGGVAFGLHLPVSISAGGFDPGEDSLESSDGNFAYDNSRAFGRDRWTPSEWSWELHTDDSVTAEEALADARALEQAWGRDRRRGAIGQVRELRYRLAGRERLVFGRPGKWTNEVDGLHYGLVKAQATFRRADMRYYDAEPREFGVVLPAATPSGLVAPLVTPLTTLVGTVGTGSLSGSEVGGTTPAPFRARISAEEGTLINPGISGDGWEVSLETVLAPGHYVDISTFPWDAGVTLNGAEVINGSLTIASRLSKARLDPEGSTISFHGVDFTGTAICTLAWHPAHETI